MRHPLRTTVLVLTAAVLLTGCTTLQNFRLLLTVVSKADGRPMPGARVTMDTYGREERLADPDYGRLGETDGQGSLTHDFMVSPYPSDAPRWLVKVSADGFEPVVVDIKPDPLPAKTDVRLPLAVTVEMRPSPRPLAAGEKGLTAR